MFSVRPSCSPAAGDLGRKNDQRTDQAERGDNEHVVLQCEGDVREPRGSGVHQTLLLSNIRGLLGSGGNSKTGFLYDQATLHSSLAVAVTETWLKPDMKDSELLVNFPGYTLYRCDRLRRSCGGVCVFLRDDLSAECIGSFDNGVCELLVLKIHSLDTVLVVVYRPPDTRLAEFSPALTELNKLLSELPSPSPSLVLMGDLNFPTSVMQWPRVDGCLVPQVNGHRGEGTADGLQDRLQAQRFCDLMLSHHLAQQVDQPTRDMEILDLVCTSDHHLVSHISTESFPMFTDHRLVSVTVNYSLGVKPNKEECYLLDSGRRLRQLDFTKAPWPDIRRELKGLDWSPMSRLARTSPTLAHSWFLCQILPILERLVPIRKTGGGRNKLHRKRKLLWRKLGQTKKRMEKASSVQKIARLLQDRQDLELELKAMYCDLNQAAENKVIAEMKENSKVFFSYAKARQKTHAKVGPFLDPETGVLNIDPEHSVKCLSEQYSAVFTQPRPEWSIPCMEDFFRVDNTGPTGPILTEIDFSDSDIEFACSELSLSSAPGPDGVPPALLKICRKELKYPLYTLWRSSLNQGFIPPDLLLVLISPIHKGGSRADPAQYRPVALTSHITKVFERVVRRALVTHLEMQDLLPADQHGFREYRSTLTQLLSHWDQVLDHLEQGEAVDVIYTDFSKAFDKCETNVLLHTLRECGVKGRVGLWLAAFLDPNTRKQAVGVDGRISDLAQVISGVPQGTVLGPILFLIHIRGISSSLSPGTHSSSFADDTRIWRGVRTMEDCALLQSDLQSVYSWAETINMVFNSDKFEWVRYVVNPASDPSFQYLSPDLTGIEKKDNLRDLGVRLSSDLSFSLQIEKVVSTSSQMVGWGMRTFRGRGSYLLLTMFKSLVQPHLDYCSQLWWPSAQEQITKIEAVQKSLVSRIRDSRLLGLTYWEKLRSLRLYSQERRRERYIVIFIWKISQGLVSGYHLPFTPLSNRTGRKVVPAPVPNTAPTVVKNARASSLAVKGAQLFNLLPVHIRNSEHGDIPMFKNHLDLFLADIADEPTVPGLVRRAQSNSLLHQIPIYESSFF